LREGFGGQGLGVVGREDLEVGEAERAHEAAVAAHSGEEDEAGVVQSRALLCCDLSQCGSHIAARFRFETENFNS
jgi:hypothetical protein